MPELPEVETVRRTLSERPDPGRISRFELLFPGCLRGISGGELEERIAGRRIAAWRRRGKYLEAHLDDGAVLLIHLRMTGQLRLGRSGEPAATHTRWILHFETGAALRFDDVRKFGTLAWLPDAASVAASVRVGPDPTDPDFTADELMQLVKGRARPVKSLLLDQGLIGGVGNIYADEALFRAGIHPLRPAGELARREVELLWSALRDVLEEGIRHRGTSLRDYVDGDGRQGEFQTRLRVYGREGEPCPRCGGAVARLKVGGRSSFHCPRCQR